MTSEIRTEVLVVGAGPVGALLALELADHGVRCVLIDRARTPSLHPKMDFLNGRSMELLRRLRLTDEIRSLGVAPEHPFNFLWTLGYDQPPVAEWRYPSVDALRQQIAAVNDGTMALEPYQRIVGTRLEEIWRRRAEAEPLIELRQGTSFVGLQQNDDGVRTQVVDIATGEPSNITARFVVACDGAKSAVRGAAGIGVTSVGPVAWHRDVYFRSSDPGLRTHGRAFLTISATGLTLVSRDEKDTWTGTYPLPPDGSDLGDPVKVLQHRLGLEFRVDRVITVADWQGSLSVADSYRQGSVFLAGDAAHQFFPTGGHGANTGLGDAVDLGWKLAAVINGWGGPGLLGSYEAERRPVALFNREMCFNLLEVWRRFPQLAGDGASREHLAGYLTQESHQINNIGIHFGYRYGTSPIVCHERGPVPPWQWDRITPTTWPGARAPSLRLRSGVELFDLFGRDLTLVDFSGEHAGKPLLETAERHSIPISYLPIEDSGAQSVWGRRLVIVRPDQHVAWRGDDPPRHCDADEMLRHITGH